MNASSRSGVSAGWNWVSCGSELLRTAHLVDDPQLVEVLVVLLDPELGDDLEHVARDPVLGRQARGVDRARSAGRPLHERCASPARPVGAGVLEAVGVAFVAVDRRGGRVDSSRIASQKRSASASTGVGSVSGMVTGTSPGSRGTSSRCGVPLTA